MTQEEYVSDAVDLLKKLIATPSVSRNEKEAADIMEQTIRKYGFEPHREANNIWIIDPHYDESRPTLLLNAHIDTVKPVASWTRNPFSPDVEEGVLYGLGSNDCGGGLCSLLQIFRMLTAKPQQYNLIYLASAEEEVSGKDGITRALPLLPHIDLAIVGEPTGMNPAVAEKGLMVLDVIAHGKSGHAARNEGVNAIYEALDDMRWIRDYKFEKVSEFLGPTKMTLTVVNAGTQHNVIPDKCTMLVDIRTNEFYDNEEVYKFICQHLKSEVKAHSFRLKSSRIDPAHPLINILSAALNREGVEIREEQSGRVVAAQIYQQSYKELCRTADISTLTVNADLASGADKSWDTLSEGDIVDIAVEFSGTYSSAREFAQECRTVIAAYKSMSIPVSHFSFVSDSRMKSFRLEIDGLFQQDKDVEGLTEMVNYISYEDYDYIEDLEDFTAETTETHE